MSITIISAPSVSAVSAKTGPDFASASASVGDSAADFADLLFASCCSVDSSSLSANGKPAEAAGRPAGKQEPQTDETGVLLAIAGFIPLETRASTISVSGAKDSGGQISALQDELSTDTLLLDGKARVAGGANIEENALAKAGLEAGAEDTASIAGEAAKFAASAFGGQKASAEDTALKALSGVMAEARTEARSESAEIRGDTLSVSRAFAHPAQTSLPETVSATSRETIETSLYDHRWQDAFTQKVVWLAGNNRQAAQITLNPPQTGPIEVSLKIDNGNATANFVSANAEVRESIEAALPRLREMFAGLGLELGQANVGAESFRQSLAQEGSANGKLRWTGDKAILAADTEMMQPVSARFMGRGVGLVDLFA